ncbi:MAG: hypothetical protein JWQ35_1291 [Bacteriovoracaceae bacterium]|nr:hypothetical protein [Bacteriovoracaceae bacterium]
MKTISFLFLTISLCFSSVFAHDGEDHKSGSKPCIHDLEKLGISIIHSGRDTAKDEAALTEAAKEVTAVAKDLGLATPDHLIEFVPGGQLMSLATLGRHAIPTWIDGMKLVHQEYVAAFVM